MQRAPKGPAGIPWLGLVKELTWTARARTIAGQGPGRTKGPACKWAAAERTTVWARSAGLRPVLVSPAPDRTAQCIGKVAPLPPDRRQVNWAGSQTPTTFSAAAKPFPTAGPLSMRKGRVLDDREGSMRLSGWGLVPGPGKQAKLPGSAGEFPTARSSPERFAEQVRGLCCRLRAARWPAVRVVGLVY